VARTRFFKCALLTVMPNHFDMMNAMNALLQERIAWQ
jgi:hypothetical protein